MPRAQVRCEVCGHNDSSRIFYSVRSASYPYDVCECSVCTFLWTDPLSYAEVQPPSNEAGEVLAEGDIPMAKGAEGTLDTVLSDEVYRREAATHRRRFRRQLQSLERVAGARPPLKLLDVGCAFGYMLDAAADYGYEVTGLEPSVHAVREARKRHPAAVIQGRLEDGLVNTPFDVVTAMNVIEHVDSPRTFIRNISTVLKPGGIVLVETPSRAGLFSLLNRLSFVMRGKPIRPTLGPGTHKYQFGPKSLRRLLESEAFAILNMGPIMSPYGELIGKLRLHRVSPVLLAGVTVLWGISALSRMCNRIQVVARIRK